jgi:ADP-heptose:LPS heptosyltransferase
MSAQPSHPQATMPGAVRRIAIIRALYLGDMLLAVPALRALRAGFPDAEMTLIGLPWAETCVRRYSRYLDRFVAFAGYPGISEVEVVPEFVVRFLREQRAYGYDLVVQMHGSGRASTPLALALRGRVTAGYYERARPRGLTVGARYPNHLSEVVRNVELASLLGCPPVSLDLEFPLDQADRDEAATLLRPLARAAHPWIGVHPGARAPARRWPVERFARVADALARRTGGQVVLTGGPDEVSTAAEVARQMETAALNLAGRTTLGGLAAVIAALDLFIGNDSGPVHLAEAVGTPSLTVFGPADPVRWAPLDPVWHSIVREPAGCNPCSYRACPIDHRCLRRIEPARVIAVAETLLTKRGVVCGA